MSEPTGTKIDLREMLTEDGLKKIEKGQIMGFQKTGEDEKTWIKVVSAGRFNLVPPFWRWMGVVIPSPLTPDEVAEATAAMNEAFGPAEENTPTLSKTQAKRVKKAKPTDETAA